MQKKKLFFFPGDIIIYVAASFKTEIVSQNGISQVKLSGCDTQWSDSNNMLKFWAQQNRICPI